MHYDHIYGLNELCAKFLSCNVYTNSFGLKALFSEKLNMSKYHFLPFTFNYPDRVIGLNDCAELSVGENNLTIIEVPGHNPSCLCFYTKNHIFTGDAYIPGINVVTILPGGNKEQAASSVKRILSLAENKIILPGHKV